MNFFYSLYRMILICLFFFLSQEFGLLKRPPLIFLDSPSKEKLIECHHLRDFSRKFHQGSIENASFYGRRRPLFPSIPRFFASRDKFFNKSTPFLNSLGVKSETGKEWLVSLTPETVPLNHSILHTEV